VVEKRNHALRLRYTALVVESGAALFEVQKRHGTHSEHVDAHRQMATAWHPLHRNYESNVRNPTRIKAVVERAGPWRPWSLRTKRLGSLDPENALGARIRPGHGGAQRMPTRLGRTRQTPPFCCHLVPEPLSDDKRRLANAVLCRGPIA
jgi:hypothetical protein